MDPRQGFHPEWNTFIFNFGRDEVRSFLRGSAKYWLEEFMPMGFASMRSRQCCTSTMVGRIASGFRISTAGTRTSRRFHFSRNSSQIYARHPGAMMIAEESTSWPGVSRPLYVGGLGFGFKWDMGWMHDTLNYFSNVRYIADFITAI